MKKLATAVLLSATLAACASPPRQQMSEMPRSTPAKRIMIVGNDVTLPDGTRATMDATGGFLLPNGDRVLRDARGSLLLPNGNRCLPDNGGYLCP